MRRTPSTRDVLVAKALRAYAERLLSSPANVVAEEARALDRALRSCAAISDIDRVWVMWRLVGEDRGWLTCDEMVRNRRGVNVYPDEDEVV